MTRPDNAQTVQAIYQAFGRGDIAAILDRLSPDVAWEQWDANAAQQAGVPWLAPRRGIDGVQSFFGELGQLHFHDFQVVDVIGNGARVVGLVVADFTVARTGRRLRDEEIHLWSFDTAGRVVGFRHYADTARQIWAAGGRWPGEVEGAVEAR